MCQNFSASGVQGGAGPLNVIFGPPIISETTRARKLKLKTQLDVVKYSLRVQNFSARWRTRFRRARNRICAFQWDIWRSYGRISMKFYAPKITEKRVHGFAWNVARRHSTDVGTWTNWLAFEPDPDYSPDARTVLLSPISFQRCYAEYYVRKIGRIRRPIIGRCSEECF